MMSPLTAHAVAAAAIGWVLLRALRWINGRSTVIGGIVASGVIARALLGLTLFWVSYLNLPILRSLHTGDGFWMLMNDAHGYYLYATYALDHGLQSVRPGGPSPFFVKALATWMKVVGASPASGLYLNLCLYVGVVTLFVWAFKPADDWRRDLPCIAGVAAFSFSPVSIVDGTQSLKDDMFTALIAAMCIGAWLVLGALVYDDLAGPRRSRAVLGGGALCGAIFCIAGIRDYYAVIAWGALALVLAVFAFGQSSRLIRYVIGCILVLAGVWFAYAQGAGAYYRGPTVEAVARTVGWPATPQSAASPDSLGSLVGSVDGARTGFELTGGATNINLLALDKPSDATNIRVREPDKPSGVASATTTDRARTGPPRADGGDTRPVAPLRGGFHRPDVRSIGRRAKLVTVGLAIVFVPISALKALSIVEFAGGRGLLPLTDLDTVFIDLSILCVLALLYTRRRIVGDRLPFVVFGIALSLLTAALLGYVVTNYGTLIRIRLIVAMPIWALVLALSHYGRERASAETDTL